MGMVTIPFGARLAAWGAATTSSELANMKIKAASKAVKLT
jgi:hypothetical protein